MPGILDFIKRPETAPEDNQGGVLGVIRSFLDPTRPKQDVVGTIKRQKSDAQIAKEKAEQNIPTVKKMEQGIQRAVEGVAEAVTHPKQTAQAAGEWFAGLNTLDQAALATMPVPVLGDIIGLMADAGAFKEDPSLLNGLFSAAGVIPFVPRGQTLKEGVNKVKEVLRPGEQSVTSIPEERIRRAEAGEPPLDTSKTIGELEGLPKAEVIDIAAHADKRPTTEVVFHGTNKDFPEFRLEGIDRMDDGYYGEGTYFTPSADNAYFYSNISTPPLQRRRIELVREVDALVGNKLDQLSDAPSPREVKEIRDWGNEYYRQEWKKVLLGEISGPNIRPTKVSLKKPFVIDRYMPPEIGSAWTTENPQVAMRRAMMDVFGMGPEELNEAVTSYSTYTGGAVGSTWEVSAGRMLRDKGYDGILVKSKDTAEGDTIPVFGHGDIEEIIIFDPKQTRSVFEQGEVIPFPAKE